MAYTVNQGIGDGGNENVQRGLLVGLPALAILLSFGAIAHHNAVNQPTANPKVIPVVSALSDSKDSYSGAKTGGNKGQTSTAAAKSSPIAGGTNKASGAPVSSGSSGSGLTGSGTAGSGSAGVVGGMGGGPTGGSTGGGTTIPDCSIGQVATVDCQVPACTPQVSLSPGQKAILGLDGSCVVLN